MFLRYKKAHKYNAQKTTIDNITFPSKLEARHYSFLRQCQDSGLISNIEMQIPFIIYCRDQETGEIILDKKGKKLVHYTYKLDFSFYDNMLNKRRYIESKGQLTPEFKIKYKGVINAYKINIELWKSMKPNLEPAQILKKRRTRKINIGK